MTSQSAFSIQLKTSAIMVFLSTYHTVISITSRSIQKRRVFIFFRFARGLSEWQRFQYKKNFKISFILIFFAQLLLVIRMKLFSNFMETEERSPNGATLRNHHYQKQEIIMLMYMYNPPIPRRTILFMVLVSMVLLILDLMKFHYKHVNILMNWLEI